MKRVLDPSGDKNPLIYPNNFHDQTSLPCVCVCVCVCVWGGGGGGEEG